jgi:glycosyltransferase involved in cell wall biosynthesis
LTVLITNLDMDWPSGTVIYTRDLALELQRQSHRPIVYTWLKGRASRQLAAAGIEVVDSLWRIRETPDVIHGHHLPLIRGAILRFPGVPTVTLCHNPTDSWSAPEPNPEISRYFGVSELCVKSLLSLGAPSERTEVRPNFVDLVRFKPRPALPPRPSRALVFSNYATAETHLPAIQDACRRLGLPVDVVGRGVGHPSYQPELILADYDLVFAVGKAALEAMAVGAAVVLCDKPGLGPMVTVAEFDRVRSLNFGLGALVEVLTPDASLRQIERYDPAEAGRVRDLVRSRCGLESATRDLVADYERAIEEAAASGVSARGRDAARRSVKRSLLVCRYRVAKAPMVVFYKTMGLGPRRVPAPLKPAYRATRAVMRRLLWIR